MSAGRVILIVLGSIGVLVGLALAAGGGFLLWADRTQRDDGYLTTPTERFATQTYALTRTRLEIDTDGPGWLLNDSWFGKIRIRGESPDAKMLFIGIGPEAAVAKYLGSVAHANVQDIDFDPFRVTYLPIAGRAPQGPPTAQSFWSVGGSCGASPETERQVARKGSKSTSWTFACATSPRYLETSACGPMPMKRVLSPGLSPRIRILPNQFSFRTQPSPLVSTSSRERVRA